LSWSANYNYCVSHEGAHTSGQYNPEDSPIIEPAIANPTGFNLVLHCSGVYANQNAGAITAAATLLLTFITAGLVWLGYLQYTTARTQLRAYIAVETLGLSEGDAPYQGWPRGRFTIKNTGQTPARNVRAWSPS
jgi:hypothetical protein